MKKLLAFVVFSVIGYMTPLYAEKGEVTVEPELGGVVPVVDMFTGNIEAGHFGFKLGAGATYSDWEPGINDSFLSFEAEGLQGYELQGQLRYKNLPIISIRYESPFSDTPSQQQILQKKSDTDSGLEAIGGVIDLRPLADWLQIENSFVKFLLSAKLRYDKENFVGKAIAKRAFRFVQADARITSGSLETEFSLDKSEDISAGEQLGFETEFTNQVLTFSVSPYFRIGAYSNSWLRPSSLDNDFLVVKTEAPVIFETEFKSQGVILELGREQNAEGFNLNIHLKYGVDNEIQTAIRDFTHKLESNQELDYYSVGAEAWFNYEPQNVKGFYLKVGGLIDYREWDIGYKEHDYSLSLDRERLFKVYAQIGYIF